jgi:salicylate hydroxylase
LKHIRHGANQSFDGIDLLINLVEKHNPSAQPPTLSALGIIFEELEKVRIPQTSEMVGKSRLAAQKAIVHGVNQCMARNSYTCELAELDKIQEARFGM